MAFTFLPAVDVAAGRAVGLESFTPALRAVDAEIELVPVGAKATLPMHTHPNGAHSASSRMLTACRALQPGACLARRPSIQT